jgi:hypothetical protein
MSPLTLPGTIPGLLRRGSPVRASNDPERLGVVVGTGSSLGTLVFWHWSETTSWTLETPVDLDLSDPTGRAHAAWWLAEHADSHPEGPRSNAHWRPLDCPDDTDRYALLWQLKWFEPFGCGVWSFGSLDCRSLATLDPNDPRLLPDGSRWVDAEALRLVCLHVAGVSP